MRFLVDANLSPRVAARLRDGGYEAFHVQDHGLLNADDEKILRYLLLANLPAMLQDLDSGCVVSISQNHLRRLLPIEEEQDSGFFWGS